MRKNIYCLIIIFSFISLLNHNIIKAGQHVDNIPASQTVQAESNNMQEVTHVLPDPLIVIPFVVLLLMIATGPLFYKHFWEHHYPKISIILGTITIIYYLFVLRDFHNPLHTLTEYISFIALLSSLFVASGGILITVDKKSTPMLNTIFLLIGAVLSNIIGTTGASMLLIRPFIKINRDRISAYHIVFFIFVVSNVGGALTPIGDPPLFLGFLRGVNFFWFFKNIWYIWIPAVVMILIVFYIVDSLNKKGSEKDNKIYSGKIQFKGYKNLIYLGIILISVFVDPGIISWVPSLAPLPFGIREIIMFLVVFLSYKTADEKILNANEFDFEPIKEVAFLFIGIFATMIPALQLIAHEAKLYGDQINAGIFYWSTGILSGFLDNAPTFLNFLSAAMGKFNLDVNSASDVETFVRVDEIYLQAISVAAVFFGAITYIGNGPNFMVKSISERTGIEMPGFFSYLVKYAIPVLIPIYVIIWLIFFYGRG